MSGEKSVGFTNTVSTFTTTLPPASDSCTAALKAGSARAAVSRDLHHVFTFIESSMPADNPSTLTDEAYLDILAYILQQNAFPAGSTELTPNADELKNIRIVAKPE